ncbi:hypothetical protein BJY04DRAFT_84969 [Aspergillus karnatakaensis]|uniref:uncharacterized protein n=1 Tax=Aspergillus karnatakaensis TaxID=1810916 RepID=UPI003CCE34EB
MDLPPEIRNQIYSYLFSPLRVLITRYFSHEPRPHYELKHQQIPPRKPQSQMLGCLMHHGSPHKHAAQLSIPFVSKKSYVETICLLYECTQFVFSSPKCVALFLKNAPKQAQAVIQHIELKHMMYNEPTLTAFRDFKFRGDRNWYSLCERVVNNFSALKVVHIDVSVHDAPISLELGEAWSLPILAFQKAKGKAEKKEKENGVGALDFARVRLRTKQFPKEVVRKAQRQLEEKLMDPIVLQMREDERLARQLAGGNPKAIRVLTLVFT